MVSFLDTQHLNISSAIRRTIAGRLGLTHHGPMGATGEDVGHPAQPTATLGDTTSQDKHSVSQNKPVTDFSACLQSLAALRPQMTAK